MANGRERLFRLICDYGLMWLAASIFRKAACPATARSLRVAGLHGAVTIDDATPRQIR